MRKTAAVSIFLFLVAAIGTFLFSSSASDATSSNHLRHRLQQDEVDLYANPNSLSPDLFSALVWSRAKDEDFEFKKNRYQNMVIYHNPMRPCLHKSFYGAIGFFNPALKEGLIVDSESGGMGTITGGDD